MTRETILKWARIYRVSAADALQEWELWKLEDNGEKEYRLRLRIASQGIGVLICNGSVYRVGARMDDPANGAAGATHAETLANSVYPQEDLRIVHRTFRHWVDTRTLSDAAAEAIYRHHVEGWSMKDIAVLYGISWRSVEGHIRRGMESLRRAYGVQADAG